MEDDTKSTSVAKDTLTVKLSNPIPAGDHAIWYPCFVHINMMQPIIF